MDKLDAVELTRQWARSQGIDPANASGTDKARMVAHLLKEYGSSIVDAVRSDFSTLGKGMRGQATPEQVTAAMMRSYVGPTAGSTVFAKPNPNVMRMFIGPKAKTWNAKAAKQAAKMLDDGVDPEDVWRATGTFRGVDGKLRQEISDQGARLNEYLSSGKVDRWSRGDGITMQDTIPHDALYSSYPDVAKIRTSGRMRSELSNFTDAAHGIDNSSRGAYSPETGITFNSPIDDAVSTGLHESQHAIQQREGWARGGSPESMASIRMQIKNKMDYDTTVDALAREANASFGGNVDKAAAALNDIGIEVTQEHIDTLMRIGEKEAAKRAELSQSALASLGSGSEKGMYRRLAGEVEARNTQARMNMDMSQRRLTPPWKTQDIPNEQQIVRFNEGNAMSVAGDASSNVLDSLNPTGGVFVGYNPKARASAILGSNMATLADTSGRHADEIVTIYRGAPASQMDIVAGDFITTNAQLARDYAGSGKVISKKVRLGDILDDATSPLGEEYIYRPASQ